MRLWVLYGLSLLVVMLDQWSKQIAEAAMDLGEGFRVTSWFNWALAYNEGAAWSFLADEGGWQRLDLSMLAQRSRTCLQLVAGTRWCSRQSD